MTTREQLLIDTLARRVASIPASAERCSALWSDLVYGKQEVVQASARRGLSVLVLRARTEPARPLGARAREVLDRAFLGERRKVIAFEMGVSVSMLALTLKIALSRLGLVCKPSHVPSSLVMLAHGARGMDAPIGTFIGDGDHEGQRLTIVTQVLDDSILRELSPSQRAVMSLVASGCTCADIAARRGTSCRTVINQIGAASRRLGVSGRFELLRYFAAGRAPRRASGPVSHKGTLELPEREVQLAVTRGSLARSRAVDARGHLE